MCNHKNGDEMYVAKNPETCVQCKRLISSGVAEGLESGRLAVVQIFKREA